MRRSDSWILGLGVAEPRDGAKYRVEPSSGDAWNRQHVETIIELTDPACTWQPAIEATADRT
jgi:hypothetical protein